MVRDKTVHDQRRKIWDKGFGAKALRSYESRVSAHSHLLRSKLSALSGTPVNATLWLHCYAFDVMGDFAFGRSFGMLESGSLKHFALDIPRKAMKPAGLLSPIPWIAPLLKSLPRVSKQSKEFEDWSVREVNKRVEMQSEMVGEEGVKDVMGWLIEAEEKELKKVGKGGAEEKEERRLLESDARLMVIAGSDDTASTLTYIFYHLARDPIIAAKLQTELKTMREEQGDTKLTIKDLQNAHFLNGVINEVLRMHPAVPSGVLRVTPKEGIVVNSTSIPGEVTVVTPTYSLGRLESAYEKPNDFIPERWHEKPELIKNKNAFAPFSIGPFSCVGKQLALMELRSVVAELVTNFDIKFAPGEDGQKMVDEARDYFTVSLDELSLVFTKRNQ